MRGLRYGESRQVFTGASGTGSTACGGAGESAWVAVGAERDAGIREGVTSGERERLKALEKENRDKHLSIRYSERLAEARGEIWNRWSMLLSSGSTGLATQGYSRLSAISRQWSVSEPTTRRARPRLWRPDSHKTVSAEAGAVHIETVQYDLDSSWPLADYLTIMLSLRICRWSQPARWLRAARRATSSLPAGTPHSSRGGRLFFSASSRLMSSAPSIRSLTDDAYSVRRSKASSSEE